MIIHILFMEVSGGNKMVGACTTEKKARIAARSCTRRTFIEKVVIDAPVRE